MRGASLTDSGMLLGSYEQTRANRNSRFFPDARYPEAIPARRGTSRIFNLTLMRLFTISSIALFTVVAACGDDNVTATLGGGQPALRVVNALSTPVDVLLDGNIVIAALPAGAIDTALSPSGSHSLALRPSGGNLSASRSIVINDGALSTIAVLRAANGSVASAFLDDTNNIVPAGATKLRVLHFAPNAGTLQVFRTQPDYQQPIAWQFPFNYQAEPNSLSAPFFQSTPGTWEVRIWQAPADASGWANAPVKVTIPLASGGKRTLMILDKPGGGVRVELL